MKQYFLYIILIIFNFTNSQNLTFKKKPYVDTLHGKNIIDDYRNLENLNDTLVQNWFKANSIHAKKILRSISNREKWVNQVKNLENRKTSSPTILFYGQNNSMYFLMKQDVDKNAKIYYKKDNSLNAVLIYDPIDYKKESGIEYQISYAKPSWNEKYIAINFTKKGEEIGEIAFLNLETKKLLPNVIQNSWANIGGISWLKDNAGILYLHIPITDKSNKEYILNTEFSMYKIDENSIERKIIFSKKNNTDLDMNSPDFPYFLQYDKDDKYLIASLGGTSAYRNVYFFDYNEIKNNKINYKQIIKKTDGIKTPIVFEDYIYALSSNKTPNFTLVRTKLINPNFQEPEIIIPEIKDEVIDDYFVTKNGVFFTTTKNGVEAKLYCVDKSNIIKLINLPIKAGRVTLSFKSKFDNHFWVVLSGWLNPNLRFKYDILNNKFDEENLSPISEYPEFKNITFDEIEVPSKDGKMIPVTLLYKKGVKKNSKNNVIIQSYGAYGLSLKPNFQPMMLTWILNGGIYVVSHVRGGGEKGNNWYLDGLKKTKPNTWNDLISTAEFLIKDKITNKEKIAIYSGSAGGITVGRAITERPDLFKVMLCTFGDLNTSRIKDLPNGPNNMKEFGNPDIKEEYDWLLEMDAYQNIKKGVNYPTCLIDVGMNDARVAPWISGKFVAKLRESSISKNPIVFSVNYNSGHQKTTDEIINQYVDQFVFALWQMGHPDYKPVKK